MNRLTVVALGFGPGGTGGAAEATRLPRALLETGWTIEEAGSAAPGAEWLAAHPADLYAVNGDCPTPVEITTFLGRTTGKPVLWFVGSGGAAGQAGTPSQEPPGFWQQFQGEYWPVWAALPHDVPRWVLVAVCRRLVTMAEDKARLARQVQDLQQQLQDRKIIERAKGLLMEQFELGESEAYRRLRETAMRQRRSLREIAQSILTFAEIESGSGAGPRGRSGNDRGGTGRGAGSGSPRNGDGPHGTGRS